MNIPHCCTCRHFTHEFRADYGSCSRWLQGYGVKIADLPRNEVLVENDEGWAMIMGPDFGCVLHEPSPGPDPGGGEL